MKDRGDLPKHLIPKQVAKIVVQALELIDIDHDHRHLTIEAPSAFQFFNKSQFEKAAVENSGQTVDIRELFHPVYVVSVLNRRGTDVRNRLKRLTLGRLKGCFARAIEYQHS